METPQHQGEHANRETGNPNRRRIAALTCAGSLIFTIGGAAAVASEHKTVRLNVDGVSKEITGFGLRTNDILQAANLKLADKDKINKGLNQRVKDGEEIKVTRAQLQVVEQNGVPTIRWQAANPNIFQAEITVDGKTFTRSATVSANPRTLVESTGIKLNPLDRVLVVEEKAGKLKVKVQRVVRSVINDDQETKPEVQKVDDAELSKGKEEIVDPGTPGKTRQLSITETVDGQVVHQVKTTPFVLVAAKPKVIKVGTKSIGDALGQRVPASEAQRIAHELVLAKGWDEGEFSCLVELWNHESGWNVHAQNPSGAYGIPQALPGSKMASAGPDWENNPRTQIIWGLGYIQGRYGTPCGAWSAFQSKGWY